MHRSRRSTLNPDRPKPRLDFSVGQWRLKPAPVIAADGKQIARAPVLRTNESRIGDLFVEKYPEMAKRCRSCSSNIRVRMNSWELGRVTDVQIESVARTIQSKNPKITDAAETILNFLRELEGKK